MFRRIPGESDELVRAVLAANKNVVVVNQSGTPVEFPWIGDAATVVQTFFGGNELGNGLADVLFGKVNPSGKLPLTFPYVPPLSLCARTDPERRRLTRCTSDLQHPPRGQPFLQLVRHHV